MKKRKKKAGSILKGILKAVILLAVGILIGVHWRVILALLRGKTLPEAPEGHFCHRFCR